ncbi:C40 family peptidase [Cytobacillus dafuensis]|uniref:NlpC/P60 family protein n=1 Tax=Cytobacillus dafuensis TaxID=1742359 RepID=A0A5B8Z4S7_CYTDA|nr:C40 family peptidase [Cytobacillus dafuensis]QED46316.1 NlpC/P60 family protein [Cytobacillus dafuensis]
MAINDKWLIAVPVATLWTSFDSARELDQLAITNPADVDLWLKGLTYETSLELCNQNLVQSQVLYGEEVHILEEREEWVHVLVPTQSSSKDIGGYPGWLPKDQLMQREDWEINDRPIVVVTAKKSFLYDYYRNPQITLSYQTILPLISRDEQWVQVQTPTGEGILKVEEVSVYDSLQSLPKGDGKAIVSAGEQFLHLPYLWSGMSSYGYDCSGFSYSMCKANGYIIPRDAHDQADSGKRVELEEIKPGDLLFFAYEEGKGRIHHVGIYYGEGKLLHSPNTGKSIEIIDLKNTVYEKELCAARRYWQETGE